MDRYRTIAGRFSRRRLLAIAASFAGALDVRISRGDFTPAEMRASMLVALSAVLEAYKQHRRRRLRSSASPRWRKRALEAVVLVELTAALREASATLSSASRDFEGEIDAASLTAFQALRYDARKSIASSRTEFLNGEPP